MLLLKGAIIAVSSVLWLFGLVDQFNSLASTMTYILLSGLIVTVAIL